MNDFTKDFAQALFNPDKINDLLRKELQQAVNNLPEAELTAFLGYDPYARNGWNTGNSRNGAYFRKVDTQFGPIEVQVPRIATVNFISTRCLTTSSTRMSWKA
ncbi:Transposase [Lactobacillus crispatus ST1]|uniref:Transposase n=1 Tax=Lactobacillus crispatus (strain ST1) TaxID=748671 RepID=D5GZX6_LACCS|nr:Transposase [Lactobacillus crispatus ST1]